MKPVEFVAAVKRTGLEMDYNTQQNGDGTAWTMDVVC